MCLCLYVTKCIMEQITKIRVWISNLKIRIEEILVLKQTNQKRQLHWKIIIREYMHAPSSFSNKLTQKI